VTASARTNFFPLLGNPVERTEDLKGALTNGSRIMEYTTADTPSSSRLVCVVDSDEAMRTRLNGVLQRLGVSVEVFVSAEDFLANPRTDGTDCLIAEVELPGISGIELQQHLRDAGTDCPVILISHTGDIATAVNAMQLGAVDFVEKPFMNRVILNLVRHALQQCRIIVP
jgi:two-component system, LuxR family, response regulator FixJ